MILRSLIISLVALHASLFSSPAAPGPDQIRAAMKKAAAYFHGQVAHHGGYVYYYSPDLTQRLGEGVAEADQIWVQAPGTPAVGMAYLAAFEATHDPFYLEAASETAQALVYGQLASGGWTNAIDFNPAGSRVAQYRNGKGKGRNFSTLDDGITQIALQFLMRLDEATAFQNQAVHEAATIALEALLEAQFPNGAFPQGWDRPTVPPNRPASLKANYPDYDWRTEGLIKEYWTQYTLNDDVALTVAATLIEAHRIYARDDCLAALTRLGDFLILAQMPEPQPAWAQQYNDDMQPIWARKFEPPAIAARETEGAIAALMKIAYHTRDKKYLAPIPDALAWLKRSQLPGNQLARYYELETNKPLYMTRKGDSYSLTYDDTQLPDHYGWINTSRLAPLDAAWQSIQNRQGLPDPILPRPEPPPIVEHILDTLDAEGRWLTTYQGQRLPGQPRFQPGETFLHSGVFAENLEILSSALPR